MRLICGLVDGFGFVAFFACLTDGLLAFGGFQESNGFFSMTCRAVIFENGLDSRFRIAVFGHLGDRRKDGFLRRVDCWVDERMVYVILERVFAPLYREARGLLRLLEIVFFKVLVALLNGRERTVGIWGAGVGPVLPEDPIRVFLVPLIDLDRFLIAFRELWRKIIGGSFGKLSPAVPVGNLVDGFSLHGYGKLVLGMNSGDIDPIGKSPFVDLIVTLDGSLEVLEGVQAG